MRKIAIKELSRDVRSFLSQVRPGQGIVVEDEDGRARYGVIPFQEATQAQKKKAWKDIEKVQRKAKRAMKSSGQTEEELDQLMQTDE